MAQSATQSAKRSVPSFIWVEPGSSAIVLNRHEEPTLYSACLERKGCRKHLLGGLKLSVDTGLWSICRVEREREAPNEELWYQSAEAAARQLLTLWQEKKLAMRKEELRENQ